MRRHATAKDRVERQRDKRTDKVLKDDPAIAAAARELAAEAREGT
jgi:hypothetical protein